MSSLFPGYCKIYQVFDSFSQSWDVNRAFFLLVDSGKVGPKCIVPLLIEELVGLETLMGILESQSFMCWLFFP